MFVPFIILILITTTETQDITLVAQAENQQGQLGFSLIEGTTTTPGRSVFDWITSLLSLGLEFFRVIQPNLMSFFQTSPPNIPTNPPSAPQFPITGGGGRTPSGRWLFTGSNWIYVLNR